MTGTHTQARFLVKDQSFVGTTRRAVRALAEQAGLTGEPLGRLDIITTELATNLVKHVEGGGEILAFNASTEESAMIRLLSIDRGSGMVDVERVLTDGVSTQGTLGCGLGSIKRQSNAFEISSTQGKGTVIHCTVSQREDRHDLSVKGNLDLASISLPRIGEKNCGDGVSTASSDELDSILVVDGLGHGDEAAEAAQQAISVYSRSPLADPISTIERIHQQLAGTRGAAIALLQIDHSKNQVNFVGVGNISCRIYAHHTSKGCVSSPGIVGGRMGSLSQYDYDWSPGAHLLMYSDGIKSSAQLGNSLPQSAMLAAAEVYRDGYRTTDDTTVVVAKDQRRK